LNLHLSAVRGDFEGFFPVLEVGFSYFLVFCHIMNPIQRTKVDVLLYSAILPDKKLHKTWDFFKKWDFYCTIFFNL
jgi:hypothetical protein